jgi:hypothetical protein
VKKFVAVALSENVEVTVRGYVIVEEIVTERELVCWLVGDIVRAVIVMVLEGDKVMDGLAAVNVSVAIVTVVPEGDLL